MFVVGPYCVYKVVMIRKPLVMWILFHLCHNDFYDDFNSTDEILSVMKYLFSPYLQ